MLKYYSAGIFLLAGIFSSCGGNQSDENTSNKSGNTILNTENTDITSTGTDTSVIMIDDQNVPYPTDSIPYILEKAGLCKCDTAQARKNNFAPCDASLFRYFKNSTFPVSNGFLTEVRPNVLNTSFRTYRLVNIMKVENKYKVTNDYIGELLEMHPTPSGWYDLVIRYYDKSVPIAVAILHKWNEYHYEPVEVLEINNYIIKKSAKDSLNEIYVKNFPWGY